MNDYDYNYVNPLTTPTETSVNSGISMGMLLVYLAILVVIIVGMWKVYTKAGKPGWASIVPFYNVIVLLQIVGRPLWWFLLLLVPFVNIVVTIIVTNDLAKSFGKSVGWTVGLLFLPFIFYPMLGFGRAQYTKPVALK